MDIITQTPQHMSCDANQQLYCLFHHIVACIILIQANSVWISPFVALLYSDYKSPNKAAPLNDLLGYALVCTTLLSLQ